VDSTKSNREMTPKALRKEFIELKKELGCIYKFAEIVEKSDVAIEEILQKTADILLEALQFPDIACAKVVFKGREYKSGGCVDGKESLSQGIRVYGRTEGFISVAYLKRIPKGDSSPFPAGERDLLKAIADRLGRVIERHTASSVISDAKKDLEKENAKFQEEILERRKIEVATLNILEDLQETKTNLEKSYGEIKKTEDALLESEIKHRTLYESSRDAIMTLDPKAGFLSGNPATIKLFGCKNEKEFISKSPADFSPKYQVDNTVSSKKSQEMIKLAMEEGSHYFEWVHKRIDGAEFFATVLLTKMELKGQKILQATVRDITDHKRAEKILEENRKQLESQTRSLKKANEALMALYGELKSKNKELSKLDQMKTDFVSTVSHELRTPLAITKEGLSLVLDGITGAVNEKQKNILATSKENIDRLARLINDLLDISKIEAGRLELKRTLVDIIQLTKNVVGSLKSQAEEKKQVLELSVPKYPVEVQVDRDKVDQILTNLISNAIKYTPEGGRIRAEVKKEENMLEILIIDTGVGISKEDLPKVFDKFQQFGRTTGPGAKGTGLGLAISKRLVEMHGGEITVESAVDKGTKFKFKLPLEESKQKIKKGDGING